MSNVDVIQRIAAPSDEKGHLDEFFLAGRNLSGPRVTSLLLSSSFGINAVIYAAALGFMLGIWAVAIQAGWALSFVLLSRYARRVHASTGIHDLLGRIFGSATKKVAAIFSIIGLTYFVGWEISIGQSSLTELVPIIRGGESVPGQTGWVDAALAAFVAVAIVYTALRGQRGNSSVDAVFNAAKIFILVVVVGLLLATLIGTGGNDLSVALFPDPTEVLVAFGPLALATTLIFNLTWQFVDNSTWQAVSSSSAGSPDRIARTMRWTALSVFATIGVFGTLLGALLRGFGGATPDAIFSGAAHAISALGSPLAIALAVLIALSVMSLIDGTILSISQTVVVDLGLRRISSRWPVALTRVVVVAVGLVSAWGVNQVITWLGGSLFDFVYVLIIAQLSLFGPVLIALWGRRRGAHRRPMWLAIVLGGAAGLASTLIGGTYGVPGLVDGAGTLATLVSTVVALALTFIPSREPSVTSDVRSS